MHGTSFAVPGLFNSLSVGFSELVPALNGSISKLAHHQMISQPRPNPTMN